MPAAGEKKKFKFDFVVDLLKNDIKWLKYDFPSDAQKKARSDKEIGKLIKPIKFKVEAELDEAEWDEDRIVEEGYLQFRGLVKILCERICQGQDAKEVEKAYKTLSSQAEKIVTAWIKKEASGKADNDKALQAGGKALSGMEDIDPEKISTKPRKAAITALEPLLKSGADERAKQKATDELKTANDDFKKNGGGVNDAVKALLAAGKKIGSTKADASLKAFGAKITKDKAIFKSLSSELDALSTTLEEVSKAASDGKLDEKAAKTYSDMLKNLKSLDGSVEKSWDSLDKYAKDFKKIEDKLG